MSTPPAFAQVNPGLTSSPFPSLTPATGTVVEAQVSGYASVYTNAQLGTVASTSGTVDNSGRAIINLNDGSYDTVDVAGNVTHFTTKLGGDVPVALGAISNGSSYRVYIDDSENGFLFFKNGAYVTSYTTALAGAPTRIAMSPNGKYVLLMYVSGNTVELWVGS